MVTLQLYKLKIILDINECITGNNACNQNCTNIDGYYLCYCITGYHLMNNQRTCTGRSNTCSINFNHFIDTNECLLNNGGCSQLCTNTIGSYHCFCRDGYQLNVNGIDCDGQIYHLWYVNFSFS